MRRWYYLVVVIVVLLVGSFFVVKEGNSLGITWPWLDNILVGWGPSLLFGEQNTQQVNGLNGTGCVRVGNREQLIFENQILLLDLFTGSNRELNMKTLIMNDDGSLTSSDVPHDGSIGGGWNTGYERVGENHIKIEFGEDNQHVYEYEFEDNILILTDSNDNRFVFLCNSELIKLGDQPEARMGFNPISVPGTIKGPEGVLANQIIWLKGHTRCPAPSHPDTRCDLEVKTITDESGNYKFSDVERGGKYSLTFKFNVADPDRIPHRGIVGDFILSKNGSEITATSNPFFVEGLESGQMKIINFTYPSSTPPTATPSPTPTPSPTN